MSYSMADYDLTEYLLQLAEERCKELIDVGDMSDIIGKETGKFEVKETGETDLPNGTWEVIEIIYEVEITVNVKVKSSKVVDSGRVDGL